MATSLWICVVVLAVAIVNIHGESCIDQLNRLGAEKNGQIGLLGAFVPRCDENDSRLYAAVQCFGSMCYCARSDDGTMIDNYEFQIGARTTCACARDIAEHGYTGDCQPNGEHWLTK